MKKRTSWLLFAGVIFTIVLAACASQPAAAPTPVVIEKVVIKEVPVEKVVIKEVPVEVIKEIVIEREVKEIVEVEKPVIVRFSESPDLAKLVAAGSLPPIEERLPEDPMVIPVLEEFGKYGGTMRRAYLGPADTCNFWRISRTGLVRFSVDGFKVVPAIAKALERNDEATVWTATLRKGMKWSDGAPFTADDFVYHYEERILNDELTAVKPLWLKVGADLGEVIKVDETTVQFKFPQPNFIFPEIVAQADQACGRGTAGPNIPFAPAHYLKQFHKKFNPDVDALAAKEGYSSWVELYIAKDQTAITPERPSTRPWVLKNDFTVQRIVAERNPYFYAVDGLGNQLPYINRVVFDLSENREVLQLKAIAGEIDFQGRHIALEDFTVLKQNEASGGYEVLTWPGFGGVDVRFAFNQNFQGPEAELITNRDFRIALSHAINRSEINEISFLGLGISRQAVPAPGHPDYPGDAVASKFIEFDPDLANEILDGIIPDRDGDGFRTLPNGDRLEIIITVTGAFGAWPDVAVQGAEMWKAVGVRAKADEVVRSLLETRTQAGEHMVAVWNEDQTGFTFSAPTKSAPMDFGNVWGPLWGLWISTNGEKGIEPPPEVKNIVELHRRGLVVPETERREIAKEIYTKLVDQQYIIGVAGLSPMVQGVIIKNADLVNVPDKAGNDWPLRTPSTGYPEQFFYR